MRLYYYSDKDEQLGPYTLDELATKRIKKSTLIWFDGMESWEKAEHIVELKDFIIAEPPPLPVREISIENTTQELVHDIYDTKYDLTYKGESEATKAGIILILANLSLIIYYNYLKSQVHDQASYLEFSHTLKFANIIAIIIIGLRLGIIFWVTQIAKRQNRNLIQWGVLALFFPYIALIIIGQLKKLKYVVKVNQALSPTEQYRHLLSDGEQLFDQGKLDDLKVILSFLIDKKNLGNSEILKLGKLLFLTGEFRNAENQFLKIKNIATYSGASNYYLGFIAFKKKNMASAKHFLSLAVSYGDDSAQILLNTISLEGYELLSAKEAHLKYGLDSPICELNELIVTKSVPLFESTQTELMRAEICLFWNGITIAVAGSSRQKNELIYFVPFIFISSIEINNEKEIFIQLKNTQEVIFKSVSFDPSVLSEKNFEIEFQEEYNRFFN